MVPIMTPFKGITLVRPLGSQDPGIPRSMDLESSDGLGPFPRGPNSRLIPYVMTPLLGWTEPHIPNTVYQIQGVTT